MIVIPHRRALLIADDPALYTELAGRLREEGLSLVISPLDTEVIELCRLEKPAVILLDERPGGLAVCRAIHGCPDLQEAPIVLMGRFHTEESRLAALNAGATDCLNKPVSITELVARIRVHIRSLAANRPGPPAVYSALRLDLNQHQAVFHGRKIALSPTEFHLLKLLMMRPGQLLQRRELLTAVWGSKPDVTPRVLDTFIRRLRAKLDGGDSWIRSVRGVGYLFDEPDTTTEQPAAQLASHTKSVEKEKSW